MTIRNRQAYMDNLWDWGFLDDCFGGTKIKVSDIDGVVERNGYFLYLETKSPGKAIPTGQEIMFKRMIENGHNTVIVIWGIPSTPVEIKVFSAKYPGGKEIEANADKLKELVGAWYQKANAANFD
jgi:hypothetical protein